MGFFDEFTSAEPVGIAVDTEPVQESFFSEFKSAEPVSVQINQPKQSFFDEFKSAEPVQAQLPQQSFFNEFKSKEPTPVSLPTPSPAPPAGFIESSPVGSGVSPLQSQPTQQPPEEFTMREPTFGEKALSYVENSNVGQLGLKALEKSNEFADFVAGKVDDVQGLLPNAQKILESGAEMLGIRPEEIPGPVRTAVEMRRALTTETARVFVNPVNILLAEATGGLLRLPKVQSIMKIPMGKGFFKQVAKTLDSGRKSGQLVVETPEQLMKALKDPEFLDIARQNLNELNTALGKQSRSDPALKELLIQRSKGGVKPLRDQPKPKTFTSKPGEPLQPTAKVAPKNVWVPNQPTGSLSPTTGVVDGSNAQDAFLERYAKLTEKVRRAEKNKGGRLTDKQIELMKKDWKSLSRELGYTEKEIADFQSHLELFEEGKRLGIPEDDLGSLDAQIQTRIIDGRSTNLKDIINETDKPTTEQGLLQEAKKHKSADEFIDSEAVNDVLVDQENVEIEDAVKRLEDVYPKKLLETFGISQPGIGLPSLSWRNMKDFGKSYETKIRQTYNYFAQKANLPLADNVIFGDDPDHPFKNTKITLEDGSRPDKDILKDTMGTLAQIQSAIDKELAAPPTGMDKKQLTEIWNQANKPTAPLKEGTLPPSEQAIPLLQPQDAVVLEKIQTAEAGQTPYSGQLAYGTTLPPKAPGVNLEKIINDKLDLLSAGDEAYDIKKLLLEVSDQFSTKINEARRGKITLEETRKMADLLDITEKTLLKRHKGQALNAEQLVRMQDILTASANNLLAKRKAFIDKGKGQLTDEDIAGYRLDMMRHYAVQAEFAGARAEAGRALSALRIKSKLFESKQAEALLDAFGGRDISRAVIEKIMDTDLGTERDLHRLMGKMHNVTASDMFYEAWIQFILSGPKTHLVNISSNIFTAMYRPMVEKPAAAILELRKGSKRGVFFGEISTELAGMVKAIPESVASALNILFTGRGAATATKLEIQQYESIPGVLGKIIRTPGRALVAADEFFKSVIRAGTINSEAYRIAHKEGLTGDKMATRVTELMAHPTEGMLNKAENEAQYRTFTNPLGPIGRTVMKFRSVTPGVRWLIPFVRTPTNIAKFALERTPLGFYSKLKGLAKGEITDEKVSEEFAKPIMGSMIMAAAALLAQSGLITGSGPEDRKKRILLYNTGWQPYSILIGDKYYSFSRIEPTGAILGLAADFVALKEKDDQKLQDIAERIIYSVGRNITSKTFLQGFNEFIKVFNEPGRYGERFINNFAGSVIPNLIASANFSSDENYRQQDNIRDVMKSRVGMGDHLYPQVDIWGRDSTKAGNFWTRWLSPIAYSAAKGDVLDKEMVRLDISLGPPDRKIDIPDALVDNLGLPENVKLSPEDYYKYSQEVGREARRRVMNIYNGEAYKNMTDDEKRDKVKAVFNKARSETRAFWKNRIIAKLREDLEK